MFGGIPPIGENNPDEVYKRLYSKKPQLRRDFRIQMI